MAARSTTSITSISAVGLHNLTNKALTTKKPMFISASRFLYLAHCCGWQTVDAIRVFKLLAFRARFPWKSGYKASRNISVWANKFGSFLPPCYFLYGYFMVSSPCITDLWILLPGQKRCSRFEGCMFGKVADICGRKSCGHLHLPLLI